MKTRIVALASCFFLSNALAASPTDEAFENLANEYLSDLTNLSPINATLIGDHSADDELDQVDARGRAETRELLDDYAKALSAIDRGQLTRANQVDAELLLYEVESGLWSLSELREWANRSAFAFSSP